MALIVSPGHVAIIIPARDAAGCLPACLDALRAEGVPGPGAELIVVDDASKDTTGTLAAKAGARVLHADGRGPAAARNLGASSTSAEILVFLDADTAPERGWLKAMLAPFSDGEIVAVKGRYVTDQREIVPRFSQLEFEEKYARLERAERVDFVDTGTAAYQRSVFLAAGGFDETFPVPSAEDVELAFRLAAGGARFAFSPSARVRHTHAASLLTYLHKKARYGFFRVTVYRRYPSKLKGDSYTPPWMGAQILIAGGVPAAFLATRVGVPSWLPGAGLVLFCLTCWPLLRRATTTDRGLVPWIIPLSFLRAFAQGLGLGRGVLAMLVESARAAR